MKKVKLRDFGQVYNCVDGGMTALLQVKQDVRPAGKGQRRSGSGREGSDSFGNGCGT